ncbi:MAG: hypothetical protein IKZ28_04505 [Clostridia bacterium]|nr:hypothetical protein [Clostridia bacterium]
MKRKKKKEEFVDDGRVVASMDYEHINGYKSKAQRENRRALKEVRLSRKERWAIYKGLLSNLMPMFWMFMASFMVAILLLYIFWLN